MERVEPGCEEGGRRGRLRVEKKEQRLIVEGEDEGGGGRNMRRRK